jgi:Family of unknown function (DUF6502)
MSIPQALSEAALRLLQPLVKVLLRNGIPYAAFAEIARRAYVEVAEQEFGLPGRKQTASRISTLTGLTRKEVARLQSLEAAAPAEPVERFHRPARVIGGWVREKRYRDRRGQPAELPMDGESASFSALVREFSGDIPPRAMADELLRVGAIEMLPEGRVRLLTRAYVPRGDQVEKIAILGTDVADLIRTIDHNLTCASGEAFFQRRVSYDNIPRELVPALTKDLSRKAQSCLESMDRVLAAADRDRTPRIKGSGRVRTGVGIYYFEERLP